MLGLDAVWVGAFLHFLCLAVATFSGTIWVSNTKSSFQEEVACKTGMSSAAPFTTSFPSLLDLPSSMKCSFQNDKPSWGLATIKASLCEELCAFSPLSSRLVEAVVVMIQAWGASHASGACVNLSALALQRIRRCYSSSSSLDLMAHAMLCVHTPLSHALDHY